MAQELNQLNLTVVALVALVAIVGLVALVMNAATVKIPGIASGSQLASAQDQNNAGDARSTGTRMPMYQSSVGIGGGGASCGGQGQKCCGIWWKTCDSPYVCQNDKCDYKKLADPGGE